MANYDMVKFERGQIWMIRFKNQESVGHEQYKDRPWLILSVGKFNSSSGMLTAVPVTTRDEIKSPAQVKFVNWYGKSNVIMCEQIRSFDHSSGAYILDYLGQVSSEVLEKVDVALSVHLGLHYSPITLKSLYDSMEAIIKSVGYMQEKADTPKFTDDDVLDFATKLQMLAVNPAIEEISATKVEDTVTPPSTKVEIDNNIPEKNDSKSEENILKSPEMKQKRMKWTPEVCKEFLNDAETLPMKKVMDKWNIQLKTRFYSMKNYAASLLEKAN